jgi:hypothetical protein
MPGRSVNGAVLVVVATLALAGSAVADPPPPPVNTAPPVAAPTPALVGQSVTATAGTWSNEDATSSVTYQWYRYYGQQTYPIAGATGNAYTVTTADENGLSALVTVTAGSGAVSGSAYSNPISIRIPSPPANTAAPLLTGKAVRGATLHASTGTWSQYPSPIAGTVTYSYQWLRCETQCVFPITGATQSSYAIQPADWGRGVAVKVTATDLIGSTYAYSKGVGIQPPVVTDDFSPFSKWISEDPLLISSPADHQCFGVACSQGSVATLLDNGGFRSVLTTKRRGKLAVLWVATKGVKETTIGSERVSFRKPGKYRTRFALTSKGKSLLRSAHTLHFLVAGWLATSSHDSAGCAYEGTVNAARQILIAPNCEAPPDDTDPF